MSLLTDLAQEVHHFHGRRVPVEDWPRWVAEEAPKRKGFLGYHCFTTLGGRPTRFADASVPCEVGGLVLPAMSELELRSPYINACNGGRRRARWGARDEDAMLEIERQAIPYYRREGLPARPVVGLDMDASYWSFVRHFSTQVEYRPNTGAWAGVGADWQDIPTLLPMKPLRSSICSTAWRNKFATWGNGDEAKQVRVPHYQPQAWRLLSDYLMSWAYETVGLFHAHAIIVDCAVIDARYEQDFREYAYDRWGATFHVDKRWEPGQEWPWKARRPHSNLREVPDKVRQRLSWTITDGGPHDAPLIGTRDAAGELVITEPPPPEEPEPAPWQARRHLTRWQLVRVHVPVGPPKRRGTCGRPRRPDGVTYHDGRQPVPKWTTGTPAPPEFMAALEQLLAKQRFE